MGVVDGGSAFLRSQYQKIPLLYTGLTMKKHQPCGVIT